MSPCLHLDTSGGDATLSLLNDGGSLGSVGLDGLAEEGPEGVFGQVLKRGRSLIERACALGEQGGVLVVDVPEHLRALPWEVLEREGELTVLRLLPGPPARGRPSLPLHAAWHAQANGPALAEDLPELTLDVPFAGELALVVTGRGMQGVDALAAALPSANQRADTALGTLGPPLSRSAVVVLALVDVGWGAVERVASRALAAGAGWVLAPRLPIAEAGWRAFLATWRELVLAGEDPALALRLARQAMPLDVSDGVVAIVPRLEAAELAPLAPRGWRPPHWPAPAPDAGLVLASARERARTFGDGFLGVEHLLQGLRAAPSTGPWTEWLGAACLVRLPARKRALGALVARAHDGELAPTPRLTALAPLLPPFFDLEALSRVLALRTDLLAGEAPDPAGPDADPVHAAVMAGLAEPGVAPAAAFRVVGGPEDGRVIAATEGVAVGRAGGDATVQLYEATSLTDPRLSRRHLEVHGPGRATALRPVNRVRGGRAERMMGEFEVCAGDLLVLSTGTRLVGLRDGD